MYAVRQNVQTMAMQEMLPPQRARKTPNSITVADLCQAIASGLIPAVVDEDRCYAVQKKAIKEYVERLSSAESGLSARLGRN